MILRTETLVTTCSKRKTNVSVSGGGGGGAQRFREMPEAKSYRFKYLYLSQQLVSNDSVRLPFLRAQTAAL